jgi:DNA-binding NtrC family response regulator
MNKTRILIVDDEEDLRDVLAYQLKPLAAEIMTAENGRVAFELVKKNAFSVILSDISMPEMNGLEFLAQLRQAGFETPFVILTGFGDKTKAIEALRLGAFDFIDKPWDPEKLRETVRNALEHAALVQNLEAELGKAFADLKTADGLKNVEKSLLLMKAYKRQTRHKVG